MCGISGEVRLDAGEPDVAAVARMAATMCDRGPDGGGSWSAGRTALGHRRLKIIDLTEHAQQPMVDPHLGLTAVFNGMVYNYRELRAELEGKGHRFFSHSDTEVILKSYAEWGERFPERLLGMFAVVIVERDTGRVVLARDRLGIKPLYLAEVGTDDGGRALRFASTLPALLAGGGIDTTIDREALHHYLTFHAVVPAPRTVLQGVRKLPPATVRVVEPDGAVRETRYWEPPYLRDPARAQMSARDWEDAVLEALRVAVRRRMVSDVEVGVLLSGGVDSSLVVGLLAEQGQTGLKTFSIGFEAVGGVEGDEFRYSDLVAQRFGTDHTRLMVPPERTLPALDDAVRAMSEPMVSHDVVAFYLLSQEVSRHVKVVQSGQGADEVFAGYHWYPKVHGAAGEAGAAGAGGNVAAAYAQAFFDRPHAEMAEVLEPEWRADHDVSLEFVREHMGRAGAETGLDAALRLDTEVMLVDDPVKRVDNTTMAFGLEARVPFLDHELVELAALCPPELKLAQGGKGVLKEAARQVVPSEVIDRPKGYFPVPALTHLQGGFLDRVRDALTSPAAKSRGLFRAEHVDRLLDDPNGQLTPLRGNRLWQLGLLEMWLQEHGL
ncbi:MAG: N-acetylglutaminylglutamine amidotransferase [Actinomycetota bacterium]|nr:N-acetylglutaminylglutamine amidotransferase [Actinomycetota bacterium]